MDHSQLEQMQRALERMMEAAGGSAALQGRNRVRKEIQQILEKVSRMDDDADQYQGLQELCNQLNMATEETLMAIRPDQFVPPIIACLGKSYNIELMLVAARSLTYMIDAIPMTAMSIVSGSGLGLLMERLRGIIDIEVTEQCLMCADKLVRGGVAHLILAAGGVEAMLSFVDFFGLSVQRRAWASVAEMCRKVDGRSFPHVQSSMPLIRQNLRHEDSKIAESALLTFLRIIKGLSDASEQCSDAFGDAGEVLLEIVDKGPGDSSSFSAALQGIAAGAKASPAIVQQLVELGAISSLVTVIGPQMQSASNTGTYSSTLGGGDSSPLSSTSRTGLEGSPPSSTPPRLVQLEGTGSAVKKTLSADAYREVVLALVHFLPAVREGYMRYFHLSSTRMQASKGHPFLPMRNESVGEGLDSAERQRSSSSAGGGAQDTAADAPEDEEEEVVDDDDEADEADEQEGEEEDHEEGEEGDEEDGEEDETKDLQEQAKALAESGAVKIESNAARHGQNMQGRHSCDGCGEGQLLASNWYRCNQCPDFDLCAACFVAHGADHAKDTAQQPGSTGAHSFTFMEALSPPMWTPAGRSSSVVSTAANPPNVSCPLLKVLEEAPYLLQRTVEALPAVVQLGLDTESSRLRTLCLAFVARALAIASPDDLRTALQDAPLCQWIVTILGHTEIVTLVHAVYIAKQLMVKLNDIYKDLFQREGVVNGLLNLKISYGGIHTAEDLTPQLLAKLCTGDAGWRTVVGAEAAGIVAQFEGAKDDARSVRLQAIATNLQQGAVKTAFADLAVALHDATTFELINTTLFKDLRTALQSAESPVAALMDLVAALDIPDDSATDGSTHNFVKLVRHLQAAVSQFENFQPPSFQHFTGVHSRLRVQIAPHTPESLEKGGGSSSKPSSPVTSSPTARTPATEGQSAVVSIEPLANIGGVIEFVQQNLLPKAVRRPPTAERAEADEVEDVLPPSDSTAADAPRRTAASRSATASQDVYIRFGRYHVPSSMTLLQVMQRFAKRKETSQSSSSSSASSQELITLYYSTVPFARDVSSVDSLTKVGGANGSEPVRLLSVIDDAPMTEGCAAIKQFVYNKFEHSHAFLTPALQNVLALLGALYSIVTYWDSVALWLKLNGVRVKPTPAVPPIALSEFQNTKLGNKAMRHCAQPLLAGQHSTVWAVNLALDCNFIFSLSTRRFLFDVTYVGTLRSLVRVQEYLTEMGQAPSDRRVLRLTRQKKRVWRDRPLDCAKEVFRHQPGQGSVAYEFEFYNEEGSGLGPTLEFYTLVGESLRLKELGLWRPEDEVATDKYFIGSNGCYPNPTSTASSSSTASSVSELFGLIGRFLARSLLDRRIPNLRLARPLVKLLRGDPMTYDLLGELNRDLLKTLNTIIVSCHAKSETVGSSTVEELVQAHLVHKLGSIEELGLNFVAPGATVVELIPNGAETDVTAGNAMRYVRGVAEHLLKTGIESQVLALRQGFHDLIPLQALQLLTVEEIQRLLDGHSSPVTLEELDANCAADHGYTMSSAPVRYLLETVAEMTPLMQRKFFQFLTGTPYLPVGGLVNLRPKFTIVRKTLTEKNQQEQDHLPSAMTCQNYLKLPAYESKAQLQAKLLQAIEEGGGVFGFT